jgi:hypothetical protein
MICKLDNNDTTGFSSPRLLRGTKSLGAPGLLAILCLLCTNVASAMTATLLQPAAGDWVSANDPIVLRIDREESDADGRVAIFIGNYDVTHLFRATRQGELVYRPQFLRLPSGQQEVRVFLVTSSINWQEVAKIPIQVRMPGGFEQAEFNPRLDITQKSQFAENTHGDTPLPPRSTYYDWAGQAGFSSQLQRGALGMQTSWNFVGSSEQEEALRFFQEGADAPKVDLTDYLLSFNAGGGELAVGHVNAGNQPLLMSGVGNRGGTYRHRFGQRWDLAFSAQGGQYITGYNDLLGNFDSDNYIGAASVGFEFLANRPGGLRLDAMYMNAKVVNELDFDTGEVPDAQENTGFGFRVGGSTPGGRFRGTVEWASSDYTNPDDPVLSQGLELVEVVEETSDARSVDLAFDILQNYQLGDSTFAHLSVGFRHDQADPLYRSIGAFVSADNESNAATLNANVGVFSFQTLYSRAEDNVDEVPTILKTKTNSLSVSYALPLRPLFMKGDGSSLFWLPETFSQSFNQVDQYGANQPISFDPSHIPDQLTTNFSTNLGWTFWRASFNYNFDWGEQDNKQLGREVADFENTTHGLMLNLDLTRKFRFGIGYMITEADDKERDITRDTDNYIFDMDWQIGWGFAFRGSYSLTESDDSRDTFDDRNWTALSELNWRFEAPWSKRGSPGQLYVRHSAFGSEFNDNLFNFQTSGRSWGWYGGFNISLF